MAAVVDARFCVPRVLQLTLTMSLTHGGAVTNAGGAVVLRVHAPLLGLIHRYVLADAAGRLILTLRRKAFTLNSRFEAFRGDSWDAARDLLFTAKRWPIFQVRTQMGVFLASNRAEQACDFTMRCSYNDRSCDFYLGNSSTKIAQVRRHITAAGVLLGKHRVSERRLRVHHCSYRDAKRHPQSRKRQIEDDYISSMSKPLNCTCAVMASKAAAYTIILNIIKGCTTLCASQQYGLFVERLQ
ncbi:unnamed protein product [Urochloa humidicola]